MKKRDIPYYQDFLSERMLEYLKTEMKPVDGIPDLTQVGASGGIETTESLNFLCNLYEAIKTDLNEVLQKRIQDRQFIDQRTRACYELNQSLGIDFLDPRYKTIIGQEDGSGRTVIGPKNEYYCKKGPGAKIAPIPPFLQGPHVTLFGPPDDAKLSINAMNAYHRQLNREPDIVAKLLKTHISVPKWGADDEDSKTPLRQDLISAGENLTRCFDRNLSFEDPQTQKKYTLAKDHLAQPIKRFPGLALPCFFLFYKENPLPLHIYDFALHFFKNWHNPEALAFYVPKLETEEEARYIRIMLQAAEKMIQHIHPEYKVGTIRLLIVLENPRAVFRMNEIMDELYPYFAGASLGWHDYLASTARLFKEDPNYRIPVKADPNIVIKYIKASHNLISEVVGHRGGIKIGGMYGILPMDTDIGSESFQVTLKGFIKDVVTQLKRNLSGFWVAHPDFVRLGLALVEAWKNHLGSDSSDLETLVTSLLDKKYHQEILNFIHGPDAVGLNIDAPLYQRSLLVADIKSSDFMANNDPEEIRYNVFQSLQYLTDWLSGHGCVALPAHVDGVSVRVMDDLATAERSRWEVWHEIHHGRFAIEDFLRIAHEEFHFIRKSLSNPQKTVQVQWDERTEKWYPVAFELMILLMTSDTPVEFATELLLPFTVDSVRKSKDPWKTVSSIDPVKYQVNPFIERFNYYFSMCGNSHFAGTMAKNLAVDLFAAEKLIKNFDLKALQEAAAFHGDIGENKKTLDEKAAGEQALVLQEANDIKEQLKTLGKSYLQKFKIKFLVSAQGKTGRDILLALQERLGHTPEQELKNSREELWQITKKRLLAHPLNDLYQRIQSALVKHHVNGTQISLSSGLGAVQNLCFGVTSDTMFEVASLSKSIASCFAIEYFRKAGISLTTPVNQLFAKTSSGFRLKSLDQNHPEWANEVTLAHLMNHTACNMHYVDGVPATEQLPDLRSLLDSKVGVIHPPGETFQYSGGGFLVLEYLLECLEQKKITEITQPFLSSLGLKNFTFHQKNQPGHEYATGYSETGREIDSTRKIFPAFAAGAMGTAEDVCQFLRMLTSAFHSLDGAGPISHDTALQMLFGTDQGSQKFMGALMGLGIFTAEAGLNRVAIHQGANDGFRCLYVYCYRGPDLGKGFTILCNAELNGVLFIAEAAQAILTELNLNGVDPKRFKNTFQTSQLPPEQVVNLGYRELIFSAFQPDLPEEIVNKGPVDPLAIYNLAIDAKIHEVSNQRFARAENLLSPFQAIFDPELFGRQGKIMDSWESVRHNQKPYDELTIELKQPSSVNYVGVSTKFHFGNQAQAIRLEGWNKDAQKWQELLPKTELQGHAYKALKTNTGKIIFSRIKVFMYPDGGLTRLGLYNDSLPESEKSKFLAPEIAQSQTYQDPIAKTVRPLVPRYEIGAAEIAENWSRLAKNQEVDIASSAFGGKVIYASNEHYGPAAQVISPYPPIHMFDGLESSRSRDPVHFEELVIALGKTARVHRIEIDFTYFVNNNPREIRIEALCPPETWIPLVPTTLVKAYAGNKISFEINNSAAFEQVRITAIPDGGMNRVRVISLN